jgi:hypothetical protein
MNIEDIDSDQEIDINDSLPYFIGVEELNNSRTNYFDDDDDDDDALSVDTIDSDDYEEMRIDEHQSSMASLGKAPTHSETNFFTDEVLTNASISYMTNSSSSTSTTTTATGTSSNTSRKHNRNDSKQKMFPFTFHVIVPSSLWMQLQESISSDSELALYISIYQSAHSSSVSMSAVSDQIEIQTKTPFRLSQPNAEKYPHIWTITIDLPRRDEFQYCYNIRKIARTTSILANSQSLGLSSTHFDSHMSSHNYTYNSIEALDIIQEKSKRSCASAKFEKYDIIVINKEASRKWNLSSSNVIKLLRASSNSISRVSIHSFELNEEPLSIFLNYLFSDWSDRTESKRSKFYEEATFTHFLNSYDSLRTCAAGWTKGLSKYEIDRSTIENTIIDSLLRIMIPTSRSFEDAVAACCVLGSLPQRIRTQPNFMSRGELRGIMDLLVSPSGFSYNQLEDELPDISHMDWFQDGLHSLYILSQSSSHIIDRYIWMGCAPYLQENKENGPLHIFTNLVDHSVQNLENSFAEAIAWLRKNGGLTETCRNLWSYPIIIAKLIAYAPSFKSLRVLIEDESRYSFDSSSTVADATISALCRKVKKMTREKVDSRPDDVSQILAIIRSHEKFRSATLMIQLLQHPSVLAGNPLETVSIIEECCRDVKELGSLTRCTYDAIHTWIVHALRHPCLRQFTTCIDLISRVVCLPFLQDYQDALLDEIIIEPYFVTMGDLKLLHNIGQVLGSRLDNFLLSRAIHIISVYMHENGDIEQLLTVIKEFRDHNRKCELLLYVYEQSEAKITHESFIQNPIWYHLLRFYKFEMNINEKSRLNSILKKAYDEFYQLAIGIMTRNISYRVAKLAFNNQDHILRLVHVSGDIGFDEDTLVQLQMHLDTFSSLLDACHSFLTIFCDDPTHFHVSDRLNRIINLRRNLETRPFSELEKELNDIISSLLIDKDTIQWFYQLRGSELFISLWRRCKVNSGESLDDLHNLILIVKREWSSLFGALDQGELTYAELDDIVRVLSDDRYESELLRLKRSATGSYTQKTNDSEWAKVKSDSLRRYKRLSLYRNLFPSFIKLVEYLKGNFSFDIIRCSEYEQLHRICEKMNQEHQYKKYSFVHSHPEKSTSEVVEEFTIPVLELVSMISGNTTLLKWLLHHRNDDEFSNLLGVCKADTDSVRVLETLSSLVAIRSVLKPITTPQSPFKDVVSFKEALRRLPVDSSTMTHMRNLQRNFSILYRVFEEKTRSPGIQAMYDLREILSHGRYILDTSDLKNIVSCTLSAKDTKSLEALIELRNKLMLVEIPDEQLSNSMQPKISNFVHQISKLCMIRDILYSLRCSGHFYYQQSYHEDLSADIDYNLLKKLLDNLVTAKKNWEVITRESRTRCYFSNFFRMNQILEIVTLLDQYKQEYETSGGTSPKPIVSKLHSILLYGNTQLTVEIIEKHIRSDWIRSYDLPPIQIIENFNRFLSSLYEGTTIVRRTVSKTDDSESFLTNNVALFEKLTQYHFCIVKCDNNESVLDSIVSLYSSRNRLPEPEELLFCDDQVEFEDILLVLNRWFSAKRHGRGDTIYCITNIEKLSYSTQYKVVDHLRKLLRSIEHEKKDVTCSELVLLNGSSKSPHLMTVLSKYVVGLKLLNINTIKNVYAEVARNYSAGTFCVISQTAGAGKTHHIMKQVYEDLSSDNSRQYTRLTINGDTSSETLVSTLTANHRDTNFHFSISASCVACWDNGKIDTLLFKLMYVGVLRDRNAAALYFKRKADRIYLEVPNSYRDIIFRTLSVCQRMPIIQVQANEKLFDLDNYICTKSDQQLVVEKVENHKIQYVCKMLKRFAKGGFKDIEKFTPEYLPDEHPDLPKSTCFKIINDRLVSGVEKPSFALFHNFVEFLYGQFVNLSNYSLLHNNVLFEEEEMRVNDFKHVVIDALIRTSNAFATRSVQDAALPIRKKDTGLTLEYYSERFERMKQWNDVTHPLCVFYKGFGNVVNGMNLMIDKFMNSNLVYHLRQNGINLEAELENLERTQNHMEAQTLLRQIAGVETRGHSSAASYVLTKDNLLKLFTVLLKMQYNLPVILMGETGIGKTELFKYIASILNVELYRFVVHSGTKREEIVAWLRPFVQTYRNSGILDNALIFFDQINYSNCMDLFKEVLCDRIFDDEPIPSNLKIVAACSPYRLRKIQHSLNGLQQSLSIQDSQSDPLSKLVYRVYTMPESLADHVFHFGSLDAASEVKYIHAIFTVELGDGLIRSATSGLLDIFVQLVHESQKFIQFAFKDVSAVSLRDVKRCIQLYKWFVETMCRRNGIQIDNNSDMMKMVLQNADIVRKSMILSLAHCYYYRLSSDRGQYCQNIERLLRRMFKDFQEGQFLQIVLKEQELLTEHMSLPDFIAMNDALRENISVIVVSILNKFPLFVVGKSGNSKSLSMEIVSSNLNGKASANEFLRSLPAIQVFSYQCSQYSKEEALVETFEAAKRYQKYASDTIVVVLLNEVGLLEQSPFNPLKVINKELEYPQLSVVGLSNWSLDPSTNNKVIFLSRPEPTTTDLKKTLSGIVSSYHLNSALHSLAKAYHDVYTHQTKADFFGLRDFYSLVKYINSRMKDSLNMELLVSAVTRNFGGRPEELNNIVRTFCNHVGLDFGNSFSLMSPLENVRQNLLDDNARNLMLLTKNNAALAILFDQKLLSHDQTEVIFGSNFPKDNTELHICMNIQRIKNCMARGTTVVLVNCEDMYESLYDLFNMQYVSYDGKRYVSLALGTHSRQCIVHDKFKVVVIVDQEYAYSNLVPPLLNRFEKQVLQRRELLQGSTSHFKLLKSIDAWCSSVCKSDRHLTFAGYHTDLLSSLVLAVHSRVKSRQSFTETDMINEAISALLWITTVDGIIRCHKDNKNNNLLERYFDEQQHKNLIQLIQFMLSQKGAEQGWIHPRYNAFQACVITYSSAIDVQDNVQMDQFKKIIVLQLHEIESEYSLSEKIESYFLGGAEESLLVLQCDTGAVSVQRILHAQYIVESKRALEKDGKKHILFLIHLHPCNSEVGYTIDFDTPWRYVFIDEIRSVEPTIDVLIRIPLVDHVSQLDLHSLICNNFKKSLSQLRYSDESMGAIPERIRLVSKLLNNEAFWKHAEPKLAKLVTASFSNDQNSMMWSDYVAKNTKKYYLRYGNFYTAITLCITGMVVVSFAYLLADVDRNRNLNIFASLPSDHVIAQLWLSLWEDCVPPFMCAHNENAFSPQSMEERLENLEKDIVDVQSDGFKATFPFSHIVCRTIHSLRSVYEGSRKRKGNLNSFARQVPIAVPALKNLAIPREYIYNYIHDYICIYGNCCTALDIHNHYTIVYKMLETADINSIADVQQFYWSQERRLQDYFKIFEAFPNIVNRFLSKLQCSSFRTASIENIDILLFKVIYNVIDPYKHTLSSSEKASKGDNKMEWLKKLTQVIAPVEDLLLLVDSSNESIGTIRETWAKILLYRELLIQITIPMHLIPEIPLHFWQKLRSNRRNSTQERKIACLETVYEVINFLKLANKLVQSGDEDKIKFRRFFEMFMRDYFLEYLGYEEFIPDQLFDFLVKICKNKINDLVVEMDLQPTHQLRRQVLYKLCSLNSNKILNYVKQQSLNELKDFITPNANLSDTMLYVYMLVSEDIIQKKMNTIGTDQLVKYIAGVPESLLDTNQWSSDNILKQVFVICALRIAILKYTGDLVTAAESGTTETGKVSPLSEVLGRLLLHPNFIFLKEIIVRQVAKVKGLPFLLGNFYKSQVIRSELPWITRFIEGLQLTERAVQRVLFWRLGGFNVLAKRLQQLIIHPTAQYAHNALSNDIESGKKMGYPLFKKLMYLTLFDQKYIHSTPPTITRSDLFQKYVVDKIFDEVSERVVVEKFANNSFNAQSFLKVSPTTSMDDVTLLYVIGHVIGMTIGNFNSDRSLWLLLFSPKYLRNVYLPTMVDDMRIHIQSAGIRGNFVMCPNGHLYLVDLCGKPMEKSVCSVCQAPIGGSDHEFTESNQIVPNTDNSPRGYAVLDVEHESDIHNSVRNLSPVSFRLIRIIIHSLLFVGSETSEDHRDQIRNIMHYSGANPDNLNTFFLNHLKNDWKVLNQIIGYNEEKTSILVFYILELFSYKIKEKADMSRKMNRPHDLLLQSGFNWFALHTRNTKGRNIWETIFQDCVSTILSNADQKFHQYYEALDSKNEFVKTLKNEKSKVILPLNSAQSQFWFFAPTVSDQNFQSQFLSKENNVRNYPLLSIFIKNEKSLYPTRYIPHVIKWQHFMCAHLGRRIDPMYARTQKVRDVLNQFSNREQKELEHIFEGFAEAFNLTMPYIEYYNCVRIPEACKQIKMSMDTPIIYCIPAERDESICSLALIQHLIKIHNDTVDKVNSEMEHSFRNKRQKENIVHVPPTEIPSKFISKHHLITFNKEKELMPEVQASMIQSSDYESSYDFERIEQFVVNRYLCGKPKIKLTLELFEYLGGKRYSSGEVNVLSSSSGSSVITGLSNHAIELQMKIPQVEIPSDIKHSIINEILNVSVPQSSNNNGGETSPTTTVFTISRMQLCMRQVEEVISFLLVTIKINNSEQTRQELQQMSIENYMKDILLVEQSQSDILKSKSIIKHVQLKHLSSLWSLFESQITSNPLSHVSNRYKSSLDLSEKKLLKNMLQNVDVGLVTTSIKNLMLEYMCEDVISADERLKNVLAHIPVLINKSKVSTSPSTPITTIGFSPPTSPSHAATSAFSSTTTTNNNNNTSNSSSSSRSATNTTTATTSNEDLSEPINQTEIQMELGDFNWFKQHFPEKIPTSKTFETYKFLTQNNE